MGLSGPLFEPAKQDDMESIHGKRGGHYNTFHVPYGSGMEVLREWFPEGEANDMNLVVFSTSGVHGTYQTLEDAEGDLAKGEEAEVTFTIYQPRLVTLRYGVIAVTLADIPFLKKLRASSRAEFCTIGGDPTPEEPTK